MNVKIREAQENDLQYILSLYSQPDMNNGQVISLEKAQEIFIKMKQYPFFKIYVAILNNEIVGTFELLIMDNLAHKGAYSGIIEDVVVSCNKQRKGIGREMIKYALNVCREFNCYKVSLSSNLRVYKIICAFSLSDKKSSIIKRKGGIINDQKIKKRTGCTPRSFTSIHQRLQASNC